MVNLSCKNRKKLLAICCLCMVPMIALCQLPISNVWVSDNGDGTYKNPIIHADYSDPEVVRAGDDFYMRSSSFNCIPGLPILHSKDLVNWELIGHGINRLIPQEVFNTPQYGNGVWAPRIRLYKNQFHIYWGDPDFGIYVIKANDPADPWSEPLLVKAGKGLIDPRLCGMMTARPTLCMLLPEAVRE